MQEPDLPKVFVEVVEDYTAGNPQDSQEKWVGLQPCEVQQKLLERNYEVSYYIIHQLLANEGLGKRSYLKAASLKNVPNRNEQFEKIHELKTAFLEAGMPILSMDSKAKNSWVIFIVTVITTLNDIVWLMTMTLEIKLMASCRTSRTL